MLQPSYNHQSHKLCYVLYFILEPKANIIPVAVEAIPPIKTIIPHIDRPPNSTNTPVFSVRHCLVKFLYAYCFVS